MKITKRRIQFSPEVNGVLRLLKSKGIHTVCQEAKCPNLMECFNKKTATFLLMGDICTRNCQFCGIKKNTPPKSLDQGEPEKIAQAVKELRLNYCVLTSVTRDDLPDEGIHHFKLTVEAIKAENPQTKIEILTPDFIRNQDQIQPLVQSPIHVYNHNLETVPRLYEEVRPRAKYESSLKLLKKVKKLRPELLTKSGIMVGLGEKKEEIEELINDLVNIQCNIFTIGQYFPPGKKHYHLRELKPPEFFKEIKEFARKKGIPYVYAGTYIRSSYYAEEIFSDYHSDSSRNNNR